MTWKDWWSLHIWAALPEWACDVFWEPTTIVCVPVESKIREFQAILSSRTGKGPGASGSAVFAAREVMRTGHTDPQVGLLTEQGQMK